MQLVIIAGGKGIRLGLKDIPKPMVMLRDRPILQPDEILKDLGTPEKLEGVRNDYFKNTI